MVWKNHPCLCTQQMERVFPWFSVKTCRLWQHNRALPQWVKPSLLLCVLTPIRKCSKTVLFAFCCCCWMVEENSHLLRGFLSNNGKIPSLYFQSNSGLCVAWGPVGVKPCLWLTPLLHLWDSGVKPCLLVVFFFFCQVIPSMDIVYHIWCSKAVHVAWK